MVEKCCSKCDKYKLNSLFIKNTKICNDCNNKKRREKYNNDNDHRLKLIKK